MGERRGALAGLVRFRESRLGGAFVIEIEPNEDDRGFFARIYDRTQFEERGIETFVAQSSISFSTRRGTMRGLHFQEPPHGEAKLVRCTRGRVFDAFVDLRPGPTYGSWDTVELSATNRVQLAIPAGFAHGFLTLEDDCEISYQMSSPYAPEAARSIRWDDPALDIPWPMRPTVLSVADSSCPDYHWDPTRS